MGFVNCKVCSRRIELNKGDLEPVCTTCKKTVCKICEAKANGCVADAGGICQFADYTQG